MGRLTLTIGRLGRARGLVGEAFVSLSTDSPELRFRPGQRLRVGDQWLTVAAFRLNGDRGLIRFDGLTSREAVEALTGSELIIEVDEAEQSAEADSYFDHQLIGLSVVYPDGHQIGRISRVDHLGFQDLLAVETVSGERLVPFVDALVPQVDLAAEQVTVIDLPGLLEDIDET
ncbi:MAG: ribosome maturation factor RimM [Propionibacteriaceae bacterium]|nr:ribosome maturation factor RimM [Propionibacteriaceae bacterium]